MSNGKLPSVKFSVLNTKLVSINNTYYNDKRHGMKPEAKECQYKIFHAINQHKEAFEQLRSQFDASKHGYLVSIKSYLEGLYTKKGLISSAVCDLSNTEKLVCDCIFLPKFYGPSEPYQAFNLNCDDKFLVELKSAKKPSAGGNWVEIEIEIVDLPRL